MAHTKINTQVIPDGTIVSADLTMPITDFSSTGIDDNATSTAITIDSSERVGINITPTTRALEVKSIAIAQIIASFKTGSGITGRISIMDANTTADNSVGIGSTGNNLDFYAGAAAKATLSATGNLSVIGNLTSRGIDDNATSTAITIDSSENVSIQESLDLIGGKLDLSDDASPNIPAYIQNTGTLGNQTSFASALSSSGQIQYAAVDHLIADNSSVSSGYPNAWLRVNNGLTFGFGSSTAFTINSAGNVGMGTDSPSSLSKLDVVGGAIRVYNGTSATTGFIENSATGTDIRSVYGSGNVTISTGNSTTGTERMRVDSSGNVGIGTTAPSQILEIRDQAPRLRITDTDTAGTSGIEFADSAGTVDVEIEVGNSTQYLAVKTGGTEKMRVDSSGVLMVDRASAYSDGSIGKAILQFGGLVGARAGMACIQDSTAAVVAIGFVNPNGTVGSIITTGTATGYNTSSDYRLKENVVNLNNATDRLNQIPVHRFNFIADPDTTVDGFIAHEVQDVVPEAIVGNKDEVDDEGSPVYQGIDQSKLVPLLTAALQEAVTRIETLEAEVAALK